VLVLVLLLVFVLVFLLLLALDNAALLAFGLSVGKPVVSIG
jgi:hypothetical protein